MKNVKIYFEISEDIPDLIFQDEKRIRQVLINLFQNAIKYSLNQGIIFLKAIYSRKLKCVIVSVMDTGIGMTL